MVSKLNRSRSLRRSRRTIRSKRAIRSRRATRSKRVRRTRKVRRSRNNRKSRIKRGGAGETSDDQGLINILMHYLNLVVTYITWTYMLIMYKEEDGIKDKSIEELKDAKTKLENIADQFEGLKNKGDIKEIKGVVEGLVKMDQATFLKALVIPKELIQYINKMHEHTDLKYETGQENI